MLILYFCFLLESWATEPHEFYIAEEIPLMTELEWDSGWLPSSGNIQIRFQTVADGGAFVDMEGVAHLHWSNTPSLEPKDMALSIESQQNLYEQYGEGDPNEKMGIIELSNQLRTVISIQFSISSFSWSSSFDVTEIDFGASAMFEPFLLGETLTLQASDDESNIFQLDFQPIPTVNLYTRVEMEPQSTLHMTGLAFESIPVPESYIGEDLRIADLLEEEDMQIIVGDEPVYHPSIQSSERHFLGEYISNYQLENVLVFSPVIEVCPPFIGCYEWEIAQIPTATFESDFDHRYQTEHLQFDIPQIGIDENIIVVESNTNTTEITNFVVHNTGNDILEVQGYLTDGSIVDIFPEQLILYPQELSVFTLAIHTSEVGNFEDTLQLQSNDPYLSLLAIPIVVTSSNLSMEGGTEQGTEQGTEDGEELDKDIISVEQGCGCQSKPKIKNTLGFCFVLSVFVMYRRQYS